MNKETTPLPVPIRKVFTILSGIPIRKGKAARNGNQMNMVKKMRSIRLI
jgi:hypothetical protein